MLQIRNLKKNLNEAIGIVEAIQILQLGFESEAFEMPIHIGSTLRH